MLRFGCTSSRRIAAGADCPPPERPHTLRGFLFGRRISRGIILDPPAFVKVRGGRSLPSRCAIRFPALRKSTCAATPRDRFPRCPSISRETQPQPSSFLEMSLQPRKVRSIAPYERSLPGAPLASRVARVLSFATRSLCLSLEALGFRCAPLLPFALELPPTSDRLLLRTLLFGLTLVRKFRIASKCTPSYFTPDTARPLALESASRAGRPGRRDHRSE